MNRIALLPIALVSFASCEKKGVEMNNASVAEVANAVQKQGDDKFIDPGKWQQTVTLVSMDMPGMPQEARNAMQQAIGKSQVHEVCLSPEEAKSPRAKFFTGAEKNCRYEHFNWGGGKVDLKLLCDQPSGPQVMELVGTYEPRSYSMTMTATSQGQKADEQMKLSMHVDAKQAGQCTAKS